MKNLLPILLISTLLLPSIAWAKPNNESHELVNKSRSLMSEFLLMSDGVGKKEMIDKFGTKWIDNTNRFLKSAVRNKDFMKTPEALKLMKSSTMLTNYLAVKNHFDKCVKDQKNKRQLAQRTLDVILQNDKEVNPCQPILSGFSDFKSFQQQNIKLMKKLITPQYESEIKKQILTNTTLAYLRFQRKFDDSAFKAHNKSTSGELQKIVDRICKPHGFRSVDQCMQIDKNFRSELMEKLQEEVPKIFQEKKYSVDSATQELNNKFGLLNQKANKVTSSIDKGIFYDSPNPLEKSKKENFEEYVETYLKNANDGAGVLMLTETVREQSGGLRSPDENMVKAKSKSLFKLEAHYTLKSEQVKKAIAEAKNKMLAQADQISKEGVSFFGNKDTQKGIDHMTAANPFAIGQILAKNPEYAGLACDSFNRIANNDEFDEKLDKAFFVGTAVLSGALILTGVGTVAGAYLLTGSLSAGIAAGTVGGSILATTALVGTATELTSAAYYGSRAYEEKQDLDRMERALFSQNTDKESIKESEQTLKAFKEARLQLFFNLGGAVGSYALSATKIPNLIGAKALNVKELKIVNSVLNSINNSTTVAKVGRTIAIFGKPGLELFESFIVRLSQGSEKTRLRFLTMMKDKAMTPEKLKEIIEDALKKSQKCPL